MRKFLAPAAAAILLLSMATFALAWQNPVLTASCAPDENSYAWSINLSEDENYNIDWSFDSDFGSFTTVDFGTSGDHDFTTPQGGDILYVRWTSDHDATAQADANKELCTPPPPPPVPGIQITKSDDSDGAVAPGTEVTYTYDVTNTGDVSLDEVTVTDKISGGDETACEVDSSTYTGDDDNGWLDPGETWTFMCTTPLQSTTENEACVSAMTEAGAPVEDCDSDKVEVSPTPEQQEEAATGTPSATVPNSSIESSGSSSLPAALFGLLLVGSLGTLAYANVAAARARRGIR